MTSISRTPFFPRNRRQTVAFAKRPMLTCQKNLFSLPDRSRYLNCAFMAPMARSVEEAGLAGLRQRRDPSRLDIGDFFEASHRLRALFGELIHAPRDSVAIIPSASYGIATMAANLPVERGDRIVALDEQFPSNVYAWRRKAAETGATLHMIGPGPDEGSGDRATRWNERILEAIDARTAVVAMPHIHWTDGTRFDLEAIGRRAREAGAALVIDGTQSVGALPFDVERIRPDAVICAGYKWLLGPYSLGLAYYAERWHRGRPLEENWITRQNSESLRAIVDYQDLYHPGAIRFDMGERSNFVLVPMLSAALQIVLDLTPAAIQEYCRNLTLPLAECAEELGFRLEPPEGRAHHLFGLRSEDARGMAPDRLNDSLRQHGITVSARGSAIRISPHAYNDATDIEALIDALRTATRTSG